MFNTILTVCKVLSSVFRVMSMALGMIARIKAYRY